MASDTFKIISRVNGPVPIPGTCCICGTDRRDFVDWGLNIEYYGAVLICVQCINELGNVEQLDFVTRNELELTKELVVALSKTIREYEGLRQALEDGLVGVSRNFVMDFDSVESLGSIKVQRKGETAGFGQTIISTKPENSDSLF